MKTFFGRKEKHKEAPKVVEPLQTPLRKVTNFGFDRIVAPYNPAFGQNSAQNGYRSWQTYHTSPHAQAMINQFNTLAIHTGLKLHAVPSPSIVGIDAAEMQKWSMDVEARWRVWANSKDASHNFNLTLNQIQAQVSFLQIVWGDCFVISRYNKDLKRISPVTIEVIPPWLVKDPGGSFATAAKKRKHRIIDGIEFDGIGKMVAIYVYRDMPTDKQSKNNGFDRIPVRGTITNRKIVHQAFVQKSPTQVRGEGLLVNMLHELDKIADLENIEIDTATVNSSIGLSIERHELAPAPVLNDKLSGAWFKQTSNIVADAAATTDGVYTPPEVFRDVIGSGGLIVQTLEPGEKLKEFSTSRPNVDITKFIHDIMIYLGPAAGIPNELITATFGQNYSASKGTLELAWRTFEFFQNGFGANVMTPIYELWLSGEVAEGRIFVNGWEDRVVRAAYTSAEWVGLPIPSLNPLVEANASEKLINNGLSTRQREGIKRTGSTFLDNAQRLKVENEELAIANDVGGDDNGNNI